MRLSGRSASYSGGLCSMAVSLIFGATGRDVEEVRTYSFHQPLGDQRGPRTALFVVSNRGFKGEEIEIFPKAGRHGKHMGLPQCGKPACTAKAAVCARPRRGGAGGLCVWQDAGTMGFVHAAAFAACAFPRRPASNGFLVSFWPCKKKRAAGAAQSPL